jgi:hypothetical protein
MSVSNRLSLAVLALLAAMTPARAQNAIRFPPWEGFAQRDPEGHFDRCILYNRSIAALTASPSNMLGVSRDTENRIGLLVFYEPRALTRGGNVPLALKIDDHGPITIPSQVISDFHLRTIEPLDSATVAELRTAHSIETTIQGKRQSFAVADVAGVLRTLADCVIDNKAK